MLSNSAARPLSLELYPLELYLLGNEHLKIKRNNFRQISKRERLSAFVQRL